MKLFGVILKLIQSFTLTNSEDFQQLSVDVQEWESTAVEDSDNKVKALYAKLHKGVFLRLLMPFVFFFVAKEMKKMLSGNDEDIFE
ncbi:MAG: hypothetical protein Wins2KO_04210 [Winogradskyella sp.]